MASTLIKDLARFIDEGAVEDFLQGVGLQRRAALSSAFSGLGLFTAGLVAGAAVSLLFAPKTGEQLRKDLAQRMSSLRNDVQDKVQSVTKKGERYNPPS
jgi:hypothetical protein